MKSKKIISGLLALTFVFGGTALPNTVVNNSVVASAATQNVEVLTYGDYDYIQLEEGTVEIAKYNGTDEVVEIPSEIDGAAVTSIGEFAFSGNKKVMKATMPECIKNIGWRAFFECSNLLEVTIPDGVETIGGQSFHACSKLREVIIPDSVETLGGGAFSYCYDLERVALSNKLTKIDNETFESCNKLKEIKLPSGIKSIGKQAFLSCKNLEKINLPDGLEKIYDEAFKNCNKITKIEMPDSVTYIGTSAFSYCPSLTDVKLSANVKTIYNYNFYECANLKELEVPASLKTIGRGTFGYNYSSSDESKEPSFTLKCHNENSSVVKKHALEYHINFKVIDAEEKTEYPEVTEAIFAKLPRVNGVNYGQFRLNWTEVEGAEQYAIVVNLSGKWKAQAYTDKTTFTSPKLKSGKSYKVTIVAKVNGKWETTDFTKRAFDITVK